VTTVLPGKAFGRDSRSVEIVWGDDPRTATEEETAWEGGRAGVALRAGSGRSGSWWASPGGT
jgi:hypothetical protein